MKLYKAFHDSVQTTGPILLAATFIRHSSYTKTLSSPHMLAFLPLLLSSFSFAMYSPLLPHFLNIWYLRPPSGCHLLQGAICPAAFYLNLLMKSHPAPECVLPNSSSISTPGLGGLSRRRHVCAIFDTYSTLHQFSSVAHSCPTLCDPMNRSTPGLPAHQQLAESTQTLVH